MDLIVQLKHIEVFQKLPDADQVILSKSARRRNLKPGEYLCHQGDIWRYVFWMATGKLRWAMLSAGGREHVLFHINADQLFWAHSFFDEQPMPASLSAVERSLVYLWHVDDIKTVLFRNPEVLWEVNKLQIAIMRRARQVIYGLAFQPVAGRLANLLLDRFRGKDESTQERDLSLSEIAATVATSPEVVCRLLHQFQEDGILEVTRTTITLCDKTSLEELVELG